MFFRYVFLTPIYAIKLILLSQIIQVKNLYRETFPSFLLPILYILLNLCIELAYKFNI